MRISEKRERLGALLRVFELEGFNESLTLLAAGVGAGTATILMVRWLGQRGVTRLFVDKEIPCLAHSTASSQQAL